MVERLNGIQEVRGSTPLISTKRELSERHYYRTVGSGSFFIAAERITRYERSRVVKTLDFFHITI